MAAITFDTLKFVKKLETSGVDPKQAEAIAEAFKEAQGEIGLLPSDIVNLKRDIDDVRRDIHEQSLKMTINLGLMIAAATGIIATLLKLF